jgi:hypothetical protein
LRRWQLRVHEQVQWPSMHSSAEAVLFDLLRRLLLQKWLLLEMRLLLLRLLLLLQKGM